MSPSTKQALLSIVALIFLLSACVPAQPTQNPEVIANQVATSVALTVVAQNAQTQSAQSPTPEATNTTLPTQTPDVPPTPTLLPSTPTLVVTLPPTTVSGGGGGGGTTSKSEYACDTIRRRPQDNTVFRPGDKFDIKWTIINTGTKNLRAGLDLHYNSGPQMTSRTRLELPELKPGDQYAVDFDAVAPASEGHQVMTFMVEGGLCFPYVAIIVEK